MMRPEGHARCGHRPHIDDQYPQEREPAQPVHVREARPVGERPFLLGVGWEHRYKKWAAFASNKTYEFSFFHTYNA
jgi:hypothetical protein